MSINNIIHNIAGTIKSAFRIGLNGPSVRQGTVAPNVVPTDGNDGDVYIQYGATSKFWQRRGGVWINIGSDAFSRTPVATGSYSVLASDHYLGVNVNGPVTITLPPGVPGKQYIIKDESGLADADRAITILPNGIETIDMQTSMIIQAGYVSLTLVYGSEWHLI
jgi:hypothetical protein